MQRPLKLSNSGPDMLNDFLFLQNSDFIISFVYEVHTLNFDDLVVTVM